MERRKSTITLTSKTARMKLAPRGKVYLDRVAPKLFLGYRRVPSGAGSWSQKINGKLTRFALADDFEDANNTTVMSYWQAEAHVLKQARGAGAGDPAMTLREAVQPYADSLAANAQPRSNLTTLQGHLTEPLLARTIVSLAREDFEAWVREMGAKGLKPSSVRRVGKTFAAMLNHAAARDRRIANSSAWREGLKVANDTMPPRTNYYLSEATITAIRREAVVVGDANFAALVAVLSGTGVRESQALKIMPQDLLTENPERAQVMVWCSRKGHKRQPEQRMVAITPGLARILRAQAIARGPNKPILAPVSDLSGRFKLVLARLALDATLTPYCMRHSSVIRQIRAGVPLRIIAFSHDTSILEIERTYGRYLNPASDDMTRGALLADDAPEPAGDNVVVMVRGGNGS